MSVDLPGVLLSGADEVRAVPPELSAVLRRSLRAVPRVRCRVLPGRDNLLLGLRRGPVEGRGNEALQAVRRTLPNLFRVSDPLSLLPRWKVPRALLRRVRALLPARALRGKRDLPTLPGGVRDLHERPRLHLLYPRLLPPPGPLPHVLPRWVLPELV